MPIKGAVTIIPGFFELQYVPNYGMAFGLLADSRWVFMISTVIFLAVLCYFYCSGKVKSVFANYLIAVIFAGGVGNMIDRIFRGYGVDFFNATFVKFYVFNFADCCVVVGCILGLVYLVADMFRNNDKVKDTSTDGDGNG